MTKDLRGEILNNRYQVIDVIGKGGSGEVYLARDITTPLTKMLAVKAIDKNAKSELVAQYRAESQILDRLTHQTITSILDYFETDSYVYIVMNYISGYTLRKKCDVEGAQDEKDVISWAITLCNVLEYLHSQKLVYCDMNPKNVMIDDNGNLHLLDFGICEELTGKVSKHPPLGTKGYAAPEQYMSNNAVGKPRIIDERTDVYGLGATIAHLAIGSLPIIKGDEIDPDSLKTVSEGLRAVILKARQRDPNKRYRNMREMREDLENLSRLTDKHVRTLRIEGAVFIASVLAFIVLTGCTIYAYLLQQDEAKSLYNRYVSQAADLGREEDYETAKDYYLKAIDLNPREPDTYDALYELVAPNENTLDYTTSAASAIDMIRFAGDPSNFSNDLLLNAVGLCMTLTEPVYQNYAESLIKEIDDRNLSTRLTNVYSEFLQGIDGASDKAVDLFEDEDESVDDRLTALFLADENYAPDYKTVEKLEEESPYSRSIPLRQTLAGRAYTQYTETGKKSDIEKAYQYIRSLDVVTTSSALLLRADIDLAYGDYGDAKSVYQSLINDDPENTAAMLGLITTVMAEQESKGTKDYSEAMDAYNRLRSADNLSAETISQLNAFKLKAGI